MPLAFCASERRRRSDACHCQSSSPATTKSENRLTRPSLNHTAPLPGRRRPPAVRDSSEPSVVRRPRREKSRRRSSRGACKPARAYPETDAPARPRVFDQHAHALLPGRLRRGGIRLSEAEGPGFEPGRPLTRPNGFQDRRIQPLCHPSGARSAQDRAARTRRLPRSHPSGPPSGASDRAAGSKLPASDSGEVAEWLKALAC